MVTQRQTLQQEVKDLQKELDIAIRTKDAFVQLELFKKTRNSKINPFKFRLMANLNPQQSESVIQLYEYRVKALLDKIDFLEAQLEVVSNNN